MKYLDARIETFNHVTEEPLSYDGWERGNTNCDVRVINLIEREDETGVDVVAEEDSDSYYFLYVIYETGDSFGRDGGNFEPIGAYVDLSVAEENRRRILEHYDEFKSPFPSKKKNKNSKHESQFSVSLKRENGDEFEMHVPWAGFFECLQSVDIELLSVTALPKKKT